MITGESAARKCYEKFNENLIGCCEDAWDELPVDFKERLAEAVLAGMGELLEAVRPFAEQTDAKNITDEDRRRLINVYESLQQHRKD